MTTSTTSKRTWFRRRDKRPSAEPIQQAQLILDELARQIDVINARQAALVDRASIIIAADIVLTVLAVTQLPTVWLLVPIAVSFVSVGAALRSIRLWKSKGSFMTTGVRDELLRADPYSVAYGFTRDRLNELNASLTDLKRKQRQVRLATWLLIVAWAGAVFAGVAHYFHYI